MFTGKSSVLACLFLAFASCGSSADPVDPNAPITGESTENADASASQLPEMPVDPNETGETQPGQNAQTGGSALAEEGFNPETHARIWIRVLREEDNSPVVGCPVSLQWTRQGQSLGRITSETDEAGMARFPVEARLFVQGIKVMGSASNAPLQIPLSKVFQVGDHDPIEVHVKRPAVFKGRVIDEEGNSVPGASIQVWAEKRWAIEGISGKEPTVTGTADANGNFGVGGMPGGPFVLSATADGMFAVQRAMGGNGFGEVLENIEIVMARSSMIQGDVLDENNNGVGGATIEVGEAKRRVRHTKTSDPRLTYIPPRQWIVQTQSDGGFVIPSVPQGATWNVRIRHDDFLDSFSKFEADLGVARFYLERGLELHLLVTDMEGKKIGNGSAVLLSKNNRWQTVLGGSAVIRGLVEDPDAILMVHSVGHAVKTIWPVEMNTADAPMEIMLEPAHPIVGLVKNGSGDAMPNVRIQIKGLDLFEPDLMVAYPGLLPEKVFAFDERVSDEEGAFRLPGLYAGRYELTATAPDGRTLEQTVEGGTLDLNLVFD